MKKNLLILLICFFLCFLLSCDTAKGPQNHIISSFEIDADLDRVTWKCRTLLSLSKEHASSGPSCLKMELYPDEYPGISFKNIKRNWQGYDALLLDVFSPVENMENCRIVIRIDDKENTPPYGDRYNKGFELKPGMNHLEVPLNTLIAPNGRPLDLSRIHTFILFMVNPKEKKTIFVDYVRLSKKSLKNKNPLPIGPSL